MAEPDPPPSVAAASPAWRTSLDVEGQDAGHYPDHVNAGLLDMLAFAPRRALELGCAGGAFGAAVKARHPAAHVPGIEAGRAPAVKAATRIDRVIRARIEDIDFAAHGIAHGEIDTVIAADILEHVVNPWSVLERLKPFLGADA